MLKGRFFLFHPVFAQSMVYGEVQTLNSNLFDRLLSVHIFAAGVSATNSFSYQDGIFSAGYVEHVIPDSVSAIN